MSDIVERLRQVGRDDYANCGSIRHEAADEIARLRLRAASLVRDKGLLENMIHDLRTMIGGLRKELQVAAAIRDGLEKNYTQLQTAFERVFSELSKHKDELWIHELIAKLRD